MIKTESANQDLGLWNWINSGVSLPRLSSSLRVPVREHGDKAEITNNTNTPNLFRIHSEPNQPIYTYSWKGKETNAISIKKTKLKT